MKKARARKLTAGGVKRLPVGTLIDRVQDDDPETRIHYILVQSGKQKVMRLVTCWDSTRKIDDVPGWHFEKIEGAE